MPDTVHVDVTVAELAADTVPHVQRYRDFGDYGPQLQALINEWQQYPGSILKCPPGRYRIAQPLFADPSKGGTFDFTGCLFDYTYGTEPFLTAESSAGGGGYKKYLKVIGGEVISANGAPACYRIDDAQGNEFQSPRASGFDGPMFHIVNGTSWSELNYISRPKSANRHCVKWTPSTTPPGTASFARTHIISPVASGGVSGEAQFELEGGVYGSVIMNIGGNVTSGSYVIRCRAGHYKGTAIVNLDCETTDGGGGGAVAFVAENVGTSIMPVFYGALNMGQANHLFHPDPLKRPRFAPMMLPGPLELMNMDVNPGTTAEGVRLFAQAGVPKWRSTGNVINV